jgi:ABC-2 type transport system ATP-binding protein
MTIPLETTHLSKHYGRATALRDVTLTIPEGSISALIGPNGAGKSTLLRLATGLATPTEGSISVFGGNPRTDAAAILPRIGFVAQDRPLYPRLTVEETCSFAEKLNPSWDRPYALSRLERLGIDRRQKAGKLSGGQQAQVALVLALAKHPEFILLDEPTASLDPLARREFLQVLMEAVAHDGMTVLLSSHNVADLERVCDHVVIISRGTVQVTESLEDFLRTHRLLVGARADHQEIGRVRKVIHMSSTDRQTTLLVRANGHLYDPRWDVRDVGFEEVVLGYLARNGESVEESAERIAS